MIQDQLSYSDKQHHILACLAGCYGIGNRDIGLLQAYLQPSETIEVIWGFSHGDFMLAGWSQKKINKWLSFRDRYVSPDDFSYVLESQGIGVVTVWDEAYPRLLKDISTCPFALFYRGQKELLQTQCVAMVGTRKPSGYGKQMTASLAAELAASGLAIVSGLAFGIDATAHQSTLDIGGSTIAVLGNGIDQIQPRSNQSLGDRIIQEGCVVSEYPPGVPPLRQHFPARNRLVSGMSAAVIVIEGMVDSGSQITAEFAFEQSKPVFALPGEISNPLTQAPHGLIKRGAAILTSSADVLDQLSIGASSTPMREASQANFANQDEWLVYQALKSSPKNVDEIARICSLPVDQAASHILSLELQNWIKDQGGGVYASS